MIYLIKYIGFDLNFFLITLSLERVNLNSVGCNTL